MRWVDDVSSHTLGLMLGTRPKACFLRSMIVTDCVLTSAVVVGLIPRLPTCSFPRFEGGNKFFVSSSGVRSRARYKQKSVNRCFTYLTLHLALVHSTCLKLDILSTEATGETTGCGVYVK